MGVLSPFLSALILAFGLSMDAMAVAATRGLVARVLRPRDVVAIAVAFGVAQAVMPLFGWLLGVQAGPLMAAFDHWIAFGLLSALGIKMIYEAREPDDDDQGAANNAFAWRTLLVLAVATSIDAFAAGITLPTLGLAPAPTIVTIGVTTTLLSGVGVYAGRHFGAKLGKRLEALGGVVLIALGIKVLVEHLSAG